MHRLVWLCFCFLMSSVAQATVIFNSFGVGGSYNQNVGATVTGSSYFLGALAQGPRFTAATSGSLTSIEVPFFAGAANVELDLYADNGNGQLGALIESFDFSIASGPSSMYSIASNLNPVLIAGTSYWLIAAPGDAQTFAAWNYTNTGLQTTVYSDKNGVAAYLDGGTFAAFRLLGDELVIAVPEPTSVALLSVGLIGLIAIRKRRIGLDGDVVQEPAAHSHDKVAER